MTQLGYNEFVVKTNKNVSIPKDPLNCFNKIGDPLFNSVWLYYKLDNWVGYKKEV